MSRRLRLGKDRLTSLPDEILEHILSYLPTKDAVATNFLSKRWKSQSLWRSQLNLDFDDKTFQDPFSFRLFLYYCDTNRDNTQPIHSFQLNCSRHGIPGIVLSIKTLSVLKLKRVTLNQDDPRCFDFPSLKVLHLESVTFTCYNNISKLLSACPILEELETKDVIVENYDELPARTNVLSLSNLVRADVSDSIVEPHRLHNVHHLRITMRWFQPFKDMFHNLIHMELIFDCCHQTLAFKWEWLIKLLQNSPKLQTMIIDEYDDTTHNYADIEWEDPKFVPQCFLSHLTTCSLRNYTSANCGIQFAKYIMQNSRVLSTMTIQIAKSVKPDTQIQMCKELSLCPRNSATCKLLFI